MGGGRERQKGEQRREPGGQESGEPSRRTSPARGPRTVPGPGRGGGSWGGAVSVSTWASVRAHAKGEPAKVGGGGLRDRVSKQAGGRTDPQLHLRRQPPRRSSMKLFETDTLS